MIKACISCALYGTGNCTPPIENPLDPAYASDCNVYVPIPVEIVAKVKGQSPLVYEYIMQDEEKSDGD